ncbi:MAG: efflux RND transporter periplasmic adaptor subunit [Planctomycetia bacterium]|nr:efflux RND transporter periplasmic adaptor subunit [Planctomycetia bacterium]
MILIKRWKGFVFLACLILLTGCPDKKETQKNSSAAPLEVSVVSPINRKIIDYDTFVGRTAAVETVEIRAQVSGYLEEIHFQAGTEVKKGDILFTLDSRVYKAVLAQCESDVAACEARLKRLESELLRAEELLPGKVISKSEYDLALADHDECAAQYAAAKANLDKARIDVDYTSIRSPIDGVVSRELITTGNLVSAKNTLLTTVVSMDPLHVFFDIDERTLLDLAPQRYEKEQNDQEKSRRSIRFGVVENTDFPNEAQIDFVEPQVNSTTGTMEMRAVYKNERIEHGIFRMMPGLHVYVKIPTSDPYEGLLIPEETIQTDQSVKYVFVVGPDNKAKFRRIQPGALQKDNMRAIRSGLKKEDRIIADNLLRIRPDIPVKPIPAKSESTVKIVREDGRIIKDGKVVDILKVEKKIPARN